MNRINCRVPFKRFGLLFVPVLFVFCCEIANVTADENITVEASAATHQESVEAWRAARHDRLMQPDGWLTLVGLDWLEPGKSSIGSAADNDIKLSGGPAYWGIVLLEKDQLSFKNFAPQHVLINGESIEQIDMVADTEGEATVISSGNLLVHAIFRQSYGLRIKDSEAKALKNFEGVDNYPIDKSWCIEGDFERSDEGTTIEIANVLGQISDSPVFGIFNFKRDGKVFSLMALGSEESENLWFIFTDRTSGRGTYGAGRFLYSDGMPEDGRLIVDFNKAYNPPCAFNPWSTCPLPPQENRMDLMVLAGEKDFHPDSD